MTFNDGNEAIIAHSVTATKFAAGYDGAEQNPYQNCFVYSRRRLTALLERHLAALPAGSSVLDAGCGPGRQLGWLRNCGYTVTGVDGSAEMVALAKATAPWATVLDCDLRRRLPFPDSSFDAILSIEVLRYISDWTDVLAEFRRVLRPGGIVLATALPTLNANGFWVVNELGQRLNCLPVSHLRQYFVTAGQARRAFLKAGLTPAVVQGVYGGPINWMERTLPSLLSRTLRAWEFVDARTADNALFRQFANMFLVRAVRP